jgi:hypothetical protein
MRTIIELHQALAQRVEDLHDMMVVHRRSIDRLETDLREVQGLYNRNNNVRKTIKKPKIEITGSADDRVVKRRIKHSPAGVESPDRLRIYAGRVVTNPRASSVRSGRAHRASSSSYSTATPITPKRKREPASSISERELASLGEANIGWHDPLQFEYVHLVTTRSGRSYKRV